MINVNLSTKLLLMNCDFVNSSLIILGIIQHSIATDLNLNSTFSNVYLAELTEIALHVFSWNSEQSLFSSRLHQLATAR